MRLKKVKDIAMKSGFILLVFKISIPINFAFQELIFRRIKTPEFAEPTLMQPLPISLIITLTEKFKEIDGIEIMRDFQDLNYLLKAADEEFKPALRGQNIRKSVSEAWKAGLRLGFILGILKDIEGLELDIDISKC